MKRVIAVFLHENPEFEALLSRFTQLNSDNEIVFYNVIDDETVLPDQIDCAIIINKGGFVTSIFDYENIVTLIGSEKPVIIIADSNSTQEAVLWMRSGAADYLVKNELSDHTVSNSINESILYFQEKMPFKTDEQVFDYGSKIQIVASGNWSSYTNNAEYPMSLAHVSIISDPSIAGKYSDTSYELLCNNFRNEIDRESNGYGGRVWFWNKENGVVIFLNENHKNQSVLFGITMFYKFALTVIERLNLETVFKVRITIHSGNGIYNESDTGQITSDIINTLMHTGNKFTDKDGVYITNSVYSDISPRLKIGFTKSGEFEGHEVFSLLRS